MTMLKSLLGIVMMAAGMLLLIIPYGTELVMILGGTYLCCTALYLGQMRAHDARNAHTPRP